MPKDFVDRIYKSHKPPLRPTILRKYRAVKRRYIELYEQHRLRHDDVIERLKEEFFYNHSYTIERILTTELPPEDETTKEEDPNQLKLFD